MNWREHIVTDPDIISGKSVLKGTRLAVNFLLGLFARGWTMEQVLENYPALSEDAIRAAFAFAAETLGDERVYPPARRTG